MHMQDADGLAAVRRGDQEAGDLAVVHQRQRLAGQRLGADGARIWRHHLARPVQHQPFQMPPEVAVGDDPGQVAVGIGHAHHAEAASDTLAELLEETFEGDTTNRVSVWDMDEWLFSSNSLRNLWSGRPLAEAVAELEAEIEREAEDNEVNGDVTTALLDRAAHEFDDDGDDDLDAHHLAALVEAGRITQAQADARADVLAGQEGGAA